MSLFLKVTTMVCFKQASQAYDKLNYNDCDAKLRQSAPPSYGMHGSFQTALTLITVIHRTALAAAGGHKTFSGIHLILFELLPSGQ